MSEKPASTIGFERRFNRLTRIEEECEFVRALTGSLAPQPPNFERVVELNRGPLLTDVAPVEPLAPARVKELLAEGAVLVDGRSTREFDGGHVPGSVNVAMDHAAVGTRAAWVIDPDADVLVAAGTDAEAVRLARLLEAVGFGRIGGHLAGGFAAWRHAGLELGATETIDARSLAERIRRGDVVLVDVREQDEWESGHVPGSLHVPYHDLRDGLPAELRNGGKTVAVACSAGNRSSIAASLLKRAGLGDVVHVADGGIRDLVREGVARVA